MMDELVRKQDVIDAVHYYIESGYKCDIFQELKNLPSAEPERKKGKWINGRCDQCGEHAPCWAMASTYYLSNFCPNCGANMRGK